MGELFIRGSAPLIGVVHLKALPGAPDCAGLAGVLEAALFDAAALAEGGGWDILDAVNEVYLTCMHSCLLY